MICSSVNLLFLMPVILHGLTDFTTFHVVRQEGGRSLGSVISEDSLNSQAVKVGTPCVSDDVASLLACCVIRSPRACVVQQESARLSAFNWRWLAVGKGPRFCP